MSNAPTQPGRPLPLWLKVGGSVFAMWHLLAVGLLALAAPSGPWFVPKINAPSEAPGPKFAQSITMSLSLPYYLEPLRMTHNYHFESNKLQSPGAYFEVHLKNEMGNVVKTLKFPDDKANFWVRHRQQVLAKALMSDQPPLASTTQKMAPIDFAPTKYEIWHAEPGSDIFKPTMVSEAEARKLQAARPSKWTKLLAKSYVQHLCQQNGAASAELVRYTQPQSIPSYLFLPIPIPAEEFNIFKHSFGEHRVK